MKKFGLFLCVMFMFLGSLMFVAGCNKEKDEEKISVSVEVLEVNNYVLSSTFTLKFTNNSEKEISGLKDVELLFENKNDENINFTKEIEKIEFNDEIGKDESSTYVIALGTGHGTFLSKAKDWKVYLTFSEAIFKINEK